MTDLTTPEIKSLAAAFMRDLVAAVDGEEERPRLRRKSLDGATSPAMSATDQTTGGAFVPPPSFGTPRERRRRLRWRRPAAELSEGMATKAATWKEQPRVPKGSPEGGQWGSLPGSGGEHRIQTDASGRISGGNVPAEWHGKEPSEVAEEAARTTPAGEPHPQEKGSGDLKEEAKPQTLANHPAAAKIKDTLKGAANLTPEQRAHHAASIDTVVKRMPRGALDRMAKHVDGVVWHADVRELTENLGKVSRKVRESAARGGVVKGFYATTDKELWLDGNVKRKTGDDIWNKDRENAHETYAHEMAHAVDGPDFEHSHGEEWMAAWREEIGDVKPAPTEKPKLSRYATSAPHEGWAEFGRLVYGTNTDHAKIAAKFPKCAAIWKKLGVM